MSKHNYLEDIDATSRSMAFGEVIYKVKRHRSMTTKLEAISHSTIKYAENEVVFADIGHLMNNLIDNGYVGKLQFEVTYKVPGKIEKVSIKNTKTLNYRDNNEE